MIEQWKAIEGFSAYEVSSLGKVRRISGPHISAPRCICTPINRKTGYRQVVMSRYGKVYGARVHRLVAAAFIGIPEGMTVNHKNGDKTDNRLENLEVVSQHENNLHSYRELGRFRPTAAHIVRDPQTGRIVRMRARADIGGPR